jgi:hypothetical protein
MVLGFGAMYKPLIPTLPQEIHSCSHTLSPLVPFSSSFRENSRFWYLD